MWQQLIQIRCSGFAIFRELAGGKKNTGGTITQYIGIIYLATLQLRHLHRIHLRRRGFTTAQQLTGIFTLFAGTTEILAEPTGFQLHLGAALIAFQHGAIIALDLIQTAFDFRTITVRVITAHVQLAFTVDEVAVHRGMTTAAAMFGQQDTRLFFLITIDAHHLIT